MGNIDEEKRNALIGKALTKIESDDELKGLLGFEYTLQLRKDEKGSNFVEFGIPMNVLEASEPVQRLFYTTEKQKELLYKSSLITLTSTVELFLSELLHFYFDRFPDAVGADAKFFSLDDLKSLGSIEDAKTAPHRLEGRRPSEGELRGLDQIL